MTTLTNSFEGGTSGTGITAGASGGASGNAFGSVTTGAGATVNWDNSQYAHVIALGLNRAPGMCGQA